MLSTTCFVEIKRHDTDLVAESSYRAAETRIRLPRLAGQPSRYHAWINLGVLHHLRASGHLSLQSFAKSRCYACVALCVPCQSHGPFERKVGDVDCVYSRAMPAFRRERAADPGAHNSGGCSFLLRFRYHPETDTCRGEQSSSCTHRLAALAQHKRLLIKLRKWDGFPARKLMHGPNE